MSDLAKDIRRFLALVRERATAVPGEDRPGLYEWDAGELTQLARGIYAAAAQQGLSDRLPPPSESLLGLPGTWRQVGHKDEADPLLPLHWAYLLPPADGPPDGWADRLELVARLAEQQPTRDDGKDDPANWVKLTYVAKRLGVSTTEVARMCKNKKCVLRDNGLTHHGRKVSLGSYHEYCDAKGIPKEER